MPEAGAMGAAYFYHLTRSPVEVALPLLIARALGAGWRVAVRAPDPERLRWLDEKLWLGPEEEFLPHGLAGGPHDAAQPVLLTPVPEVAANGAQCLMAIDGAPVAAEEMPGLARACLLFDGQDPEAVAAARRQWSALTGAGVPAQYWSEESGRWEKKAER